MNRDNAFTVSYDAGSDVLYIVRRVAASTKGREDSVGIVWRYDSEGELLSATVMDLQDRWFANQAELARRLSERFGVSTGQARRVLEHTFQHLPSH